MNCVTLLANLVMKYIGEILILTNVDMTNYLFIKLINVKDIDVTNENIKPTYTYNKNELDFILDKFNGSYSGYKLAIKNEKKHTNDLLIKLLNRNIYIKCLRNTTM